MATFRDVVEWVEGRLTPEESERVGREVAADPALQQSASFVRHFHQAVDAEPWETPPARVRAHLLRRFAHERPAAPTLVQRVLATISFDSATGQPVLGIRASATTWTRHVVVTADGLDVALDLYAEDRRVRVEGQVLPVGEDAPAGGTVALQREGLEIARTEADPSGSFAFPPVVSGPVLLVVTVGTTVLEASVDLVV